MANWSPQLLGRGVYGPHRPSLRSGPMHLWDHVPGPPAQNSLIIYNDGSILEGCDFPSWMITAADVHLFILGGTNIREANLDQFSKDALTAAGYEFGFGVEIDLYDPSDQYTDDYPLAVEGDE